MIKDPVDYETWYHTPYGRWVGQREFFLLIKMIRFRKSGSLLDVGSGTGYFSRQFFAEGFRVTCLDSDSAMLDFAQKQTTEISYVEGTAVQLPFAENSFDFCSAVTSLCFVDEPEIALAEMWRVSRHGVILGLLNQNSLLCRKKSGQGGYVGARWDTWQDVKNWVLPLMPAPDVIKHKTAIFFPDGGMRMRLIEWLLPAKMPWGGFLAVYLEKYTHVKDEVFTG